MTCVGTQSPPWHQHMLSLGGCPTSLCSAPGPWHRCLSTRLTLGPQTIHVHQSSCFLLIVVWAVVLCPLWHGWGCDSNRIPICSTLLGPHLLSHTNLGHPCLTEWAVVWALCGMNWEHSILPHKLHWCFFCLLLFPTVWLSRMCLFLVSRKEHRPQKEWVYPGMYLTKSMESRWWERS